MDRKLITLEEVQNYPTIIHYAIPVMLGLVLLELGISIYKKRNLYVGKDFFASLGIGTGNLIVSALIKVALFTVVLAFYNLLPWRVPHTWWSYVACLITLDFCRYWAHRVAHEQRFWWATHVTHHSSGKYNFSVSFRLSWVQHIKLVFFLPVIACGFDPFVFFICHQIEVLYQFWIHTELVKKLPAPIEYIFTTPSHHRVHHASNEKYLDKNYGSTFIIWDRIFGTFQAEEEQPIYGLTTPVNSYNPVYLVFHEWFDMAKDMKGKSFKEKLYVIWGSPTAQYLKKIEEQKQREILEGDKVVIDNKRQAVA